MKIAKFSILLIFIFSSLGFAVLPPEELPDSVINHPNPLLTDIEPLCVVVASHNSEKNKFNPLLKNIKNRVEAELKKSGVEVISLPDENSPPELAELRIMIDILHPQNSNRCFMHIQLSLARNVLVKKDGTVYVKTDVWKIGPDMENSSLENLQTNCLRLILKQLDAFTHACIISNPNHKSSSTANTGATTPVSATNQQKPPYVAAKNSKVFHKESCIWAQKLKPENTVGYQTVQAALDDGRKPCKVCKP